MKARVPKTVAAILAAAVGLLAAAPSRAAAPGEPIVQALQRIDRSDAIGLEAWLDGSAPDQVRVGDEVSFRVRAEKDAYLTTLYVDAGGAVTVIFSGGDSHRLQAGQMRHFPPEGGGQRMLAQPPLGAEFVFAIATLEPLPQDIFTNAERKLVLVHERPEDGRHLAQRLADYLSILPEGSVDVAWFSQEVVPEDTPRRYSTTTIVQHFTTRTRSLTRPKLDLDIQFEFGSDRLTETARQDLDELGRALEHPAMKNRRFELGGHTDDVGSETYNLSLSQKRAQSARSYLLEKYEIAPETLRPAGYGEAQPLMTGTSDEARRRNRRVVIEQLP
jgi:outer membrane protein OmpA-like peptidoglycan-associated protein